MKSASWVMADEGRVPLLANVASGRSGDAAVARVRASASRLGIPVEVKATEGGAIVPAVAALVEEGHPVIAVAGGDGTLTAAAN